MSESLYSYFWDTPEDRLGWSPIMAAIKADSDGEEIVAMFLSFLEAKSSIQHLHNLLTSQNIGKV